MHLKAAKRWWGALIFLFSATTGLFATTDSLGPYKWTVSSTNATVYASYNYNSTNYSSNPTVGVNPLPYGSIIAAVDTAGNCIGAHAYESGTVGIAVQGWDSTYDSTHHTPIVTHGLKAGQKFRFQIWDSANGQTYTTIYAHFAAHGTINGIIPNADSTFVSGGGYVSMLDTLRATTSPANPPVISSPSNGAANQPISLSLNWNSVSGATSYGLRVSTSTSFGSLVVSLTGITGLSSGVSGLAYYTTYYCEVNATNGGGSSAWSTLDSFTTTASLAIPLANGWSMYSLNLQPADSSTSGVFGKLKGFILAMDGNDNLYWPGASLDEIGTVHTGSGYWILDTLANDTLKLTGNAVNLTANPISLPASNWNLVSYLPQVSMPIATALNSISSQLVLVMDGSSNFYWPAASLDEIGNMAVGKGYYILTSATASLAYPTAGSGPAKMLSAGKALTDPPALKHFAKHTNTGNFAVFLAKQVELGGKAVSGSCEVGAFDAKGNLVGAGTVVNGVSAFAIWGKNSMNKNSNGCGSSDKISFRLWNGEKEIALSVTGGSNPVFASKSIITATLAVPAQEMQSSFSAPRAYPNPFRGSVSISFEVPALSGAASQDVEIGVYDMRGNLVQRLAKGKYAAGSYAVSWNGRAAGSDVAGSGIYLVRVKANGVEKQMKLIEIK